MNKYLILDGVFEGLRMLPGAITAAYLMTKGITLAELAALKSIQSVVGFVFDLPTGVIADHLGRRLSIVISCVLAALVFALYAVGQNFLVFAAAEVLLALSLCFWSGAYEAYTIEALKVGHDETQVNRFFHLNGMFNSAGSIVGGFVGAALSSWLGFLPFALAGVGFVVLTLAIPVLFPNDAKHEKIRTAELVQAAKKIVSPDVFQVLFAPSMWQGYVLFAFAQMVSQPLIYYWQPWFQLKLGGGTPIGLGVVFTAFQLSMMAAGMLGARLSLRFSPRRLQMATWTLFGFSLLSLPSAGGFLPSLLVFCFAEAALAIGIAGMKAHLNKLATNETRASVMSVAALVSRFAALVAMGMMAWISQKVVAVGAALDLFFILAGGISFVIVAANLYIEVRAITRSNSVFREDSCASNVVTM